MLSNPAVAAGVDLLGTDLADVSIGLGAVDSVLGLVDSGLGSGLGLERYQER